MKKRVFALVCCLSLTLGFFTYRPPEAKAIVTEASLATSVLWSFMQSAGITLNGTGVNSSSWAEAIEPRLQEFTEWIDPKAASFWSWLGYEDGATGFLKDLTWSVFEGPSTVPGYKIHVPAPVAKKFADFTAWFAEKVGLTAGAKPVPVFTGSTLLDNIFSHNPNLAKHDYGSLIAVEYIGVPPYHLGDYREEIERYRLWYILSSDNCPFEVVYFDGSSFKLTEGFYLSFARKPYRGAEYDMFISSFEMFGGGNFHDINYNSDLQSYLLYLGSSSVVSVPDLNKSSITVAQPGALSPTYDDSGDKATVLTVPGIEGQVSSINDLLQKILDKLSANELDSSASLEGEAAPDVPATDVGWKGTIEKIYQAIIDLPGRIADAFKALLESLFAPDAALMQEIATTFTDKFPFLPVLNRVGKDLFGMTAESEPPVIWIHLENAEGKYTYGDKTKVLDMSFYQRYKADADKLISGFLWLGFLWLLFKRASAIIQGGEMLTEYSEAIDRGYRERKGKKTK